MRRGRGAGVAGSRRKPISGKQKKEYLKAKKVERTQRREHEFRVECGLDVEENDTTGDGDRKVVQTARVVRSGKQGKLSSMFAAEENEAVVARRIASTKPLDSSRREKLLYSFESENLGFPKRPPWDPNMTMEELDTKEHESFAQWTDNVMGKFTLDELSPFEHNLEVWRQLWRTFEKSDVILLAVDVRNPLLHLPRALYEYLADELGIPLVICMNKIDLVDGNHVAIWKSYLEQRFPLAKVVTFSTRVKGTNGAGWNVKGGVSVRRKLISSKPTLADLKAVHESSNFILQTCLGLVPESTSSNLPTIGILGQPNVGKSSLLNSLIGEKVVSVSKTCGHTKHWQTHILEKDGESIAELCDSPGLIFAMAWHQSTYPTAARHIFECNGLYPIPQIRETFSAIRFLGEHVPLETLYNLKLDTETYDDYWSPYSICGSFAEKKGYHMEGGGPDFHRAGLEILRDTVDGYVLVTFQPPPADPEKCLSLKSESRLEQEDIS